MINAISISNGAPIILLPLAVVVFINGLKDYLEDLNRKNSDRDENHRYCYIQSLKSGEFEKRYWKDVELGNIVKINENEYFPADLVCIDTKKNEREDVEIDGICYVETKNLDGESNLKYKEAVKNMRNQYKAIDDMIKLKGKIECSPPSEYISDFMGYYSDDKNDNKMIIDKKNILLRGMSLQQTYCIYGIVVYIGHNTKIMKNLINTKTKNSMIERIMNFQILFIFGVDICFSVIYGMINVIFISNSNVIIYLL